MSVRSAHLLPAIECLLQLLPTFEIQDVENSRIFDMSILLKCFPYTNSQERWRYIQSVDFADTRRLIENSIFRGKEWTTAMKQSSHISKPLSIKCTAPRFGLNYV